MELEIGGVVRELRFGTGFVRKLDQNYKANANGIEFGIGLLVANMQLSQMNPAILSDVIRCAAKGNLREREVDAFLDDYAEEEEGLAGLFEDITSELGKSFVVKDTLKKLQATAKPVVED